MAAVLTSVDPETGERDYAVRNSGCGGRIFEGSRCAAAH
jgi:hypothetical protein